MPYNLVSNAGPIFEGDVFSILKRSPFVLRSFEFAVSDGAVDCTGCFAPETAFADRFWEVDQARILKSTTRDLLPFDVKSRLSGDGGKQFYITTMSQRRQVAFYIGICGTNPNMVELIPNYHQERSEMPTPPNHEDDTREVEINISRVSTIKPEAYRLDPCNDPYRMPISYLAQAIEGVRRCVLSQGAISYINPWTLVSFPDWMPSTTKSVAVLKPSERSAHFTAYQAVMDIYRMVTAIKSAMKFDFVGLQPRLADFKFITTFEKLRPRQYLVQHKIDGRDRASNSPLTRVAIGRNREGGGIRWYFTQSERFDFLFYEFSFSQHPNPRRRTEFFFIPEQALPDLFYESLDLEHDFDRADLLKYRIVKDGDAQWVRRVIEIVRANPEPRRAFPRPRRPQSTLSTQLNKGYIKKSQKEASSSNEHVIKKGAGGRSLYQIASTSHHRAFFSNIMRECARRRSGLLVVLAANHPMGDFGFCRYRWTPEEAERFLTTETPPRTAAYLPPYASLVPIYYFTRDLECSFHGPCLTTAQFRRVNSFYGHRLMFWSLWGSDESASRPLLLVPSEDVSPTTAQRELYARNMDIDKQTSFEHRSPLLSHLLNRGLHASEYVIESLGPAVYEKSCSWESVWTLLNTFATSTLGLVEHPVGMARDPTLYRYTIKEYNQRLAEEYRKS